MRLPALLAGIAVIPLTYVATRKLAGRSAGILAAGLVAVSGPFVLYSVNARGYALQAALLLIMLYLASRVLENAPWRMAYWALFSSAAIAGFWIAPSMLYPYLVVAGWLLWAGGLRILRSLFASTTITMIAVASLYMPVVIVSGPDALLRNPWVRPLSPEQFRAQALRFPAELARLLHGSDPLFVAVLAVVGAVLSFVFMPRTGQRWAHPAVVVLLVLLILPLAQRVVPFPRVLLPLFPTYYLSAAGGWCGLAATEYRRAPGVSGDGLIDPSQLTVEGMLRHAGVNEAAYLPPRLIFRSGRGEVFELLPRCYELTASANR